MAFLDGVEILPHITLGYSFIDLVGTALQLCVTVGFYLMCVQVVSDRLDH